MGEYVNRNRTSLSHHQMATFIKSMGKRVSEWKRSQNGGEKNPVDLIFNVGQTKGFIIFINSKIAGEYKTMERFYFVHSINNLSGEHFLPTF